jgi:hypothetical protein
MRTKKGRIVRQVMGISFISAMQTARRREKFRENKIAVRAVY